MIRLKTPDPRPSMGRHVDPTRPAVYRVAPGAWAAWIPPTRPGDTDVYGDLVGPAGDTYFPTFGEAAGFLISALAERAGAAR